VGPDTVDVAGAAGRGAGGDIAGSDGRGAGDIIGSAGRVATVATTVDGHPPTPFGRGADAVRQAQSGRTWPCGPGGIAPVAGKWCW
jgi:hypothetical protein